MQRRMSLHWFHSTPTSQREKKRICRYWLFTKFLRTYPSKFFLIEALLLRTPHVCLVKIIFVNQLPMDGAVLSVWKSISCKWFLDRWSSCVHRFEDLDKPFWKFFNVLLRFRLKNDVNRSFAISQSWSSKSFCGNISKSIS